MVIYVHIFMYIYVHSQKDFATYYNSRNGEYNVGFAFQNGGAHDQTKTSNFG